MANTIRELGHEAQVRMWTDAGGAIKHMETKYFLAATEREKPGAQDREDPRYSQSRRLAGSETFGNVVRAVEHQAY